MLQLHMTELVEGHIYSKDDFIDVADDTENIDEFINETPYDKLFSEATKDIIDKNEEAPSSSSRDRNRQKVQETFQRVDDIEMKQLLESWIYKYTSVFNGKLDETPARVKPFKL